MAADFHAQTMQLFMDSVDPLVETCGRHCLGKLSDLPPDLVQPHTDGLAGALGLNGDMIVMLAKMADAGAEIAVGLKEEILVPITFRPRRRG